MGSLYLPSIGVIEAARELVAAADALLPSPDHPVDPAETIERITRCAGAEARLCNVAERRALDLRAFANAGADVKRCKCQPPTHTCGDDRSSAGPRCNAGGHPRYVETRCARPAGHVGEHSSHAGLTWR